METKKTNKKALIGIIALVAIVVILAVMYVVFRQKPVEGSKAITIKVVNKAEETKEYSVKTDAEYLHGAMDEAKGLTFSGTEDDTFGMMLDTINGETADFNVDGSYWAIFVNDEYGNYGIDQQPVADGDVYTFVYTAWVQ